jgi:hypothetical protein
MRWIAGFRYPEGARIHFLRHHFKLFYGLPSLLLNEYRGISPVVNQPERDSGPYFTPKAFVEH